MCRVIPFNFWRKGGEEWSFGVIGLGHDGRVERCTSICISVLVGVILRCRDTIWVEVDHRPD
jgi:hypothetical protein